MRALGRIARLLAQLAPEDELLEARGVERRAAVVSLPFVAPEREQARKLGFAFDTLGRDRDAEGLREDRDRPHDRLVGGLGVDGAQERAVDLQLVDRQAAQ